MCAISPLFTAGCNSLTVTHCVENENRAHVILASQQAKRWHQKLLPSWILTL
jgi:hypothetical protein